MNPEPRASDGPDADPGSAFPGAHPGFGSGLRLWLVRHAEVAAEWQGRAYGDLDVPLSPAGEERSAAVARSLAALEPDRLVSSPLQRAHHLATTLAAASTAPWERDPRLREIHRGDWQGERVEALKSERAPEVDAFYADPWSFRGHGGESDADLHARAWPVLEEAQASLARAGRPGGCLVLVSHYNVLRVLCARALGIEPARSFSLRVDPAHAVLLEDRPGGWTLCHANCSDPKVAYDTARSARA